MDRRRRIGMVTMMIVIFVRRTIMMIIMIMIIIDDGNLYQVVLLDHGMYRRLHESFRRSYCNLWKAFMTR